MIEYKILSEDSPYCKGKGVLGLQDTVERHLKEEWKPLGGFAIEMVNGPTGTIRVVYHQTMIREVE